MASTTLVVPSLLHRLSGTGATYWGPGDLYRFLVTGAETGGAYFAMEAVVPPGGGPPPHTHAREDETFYVLEGRVDFRLGDERVTAGPGDFVNVPRGRVHNFHNAGRGLRPGGDARARAAARRLARHHVGARGHAHRGDAARRLTRPPI